MVSIMKKNTAKYIVIAVYLILTLVVPVIGILIPLNKVELPQSLIPTEVKEFSQNYLTAIKSGNTTEVYRMNSSEINVATSQIAVITSALNDVQMDTMKPIAFMYKEVENKFIDKTESVDLYQLMYEAKNATTSPDSVYILSTLVLTRSEHEGLRLYGINIQGQSRAYIDRSRMTFSDIAEHPWYAIIAGLLNLFVAFTAIHYVRKSVRPRWLIVFIILLVSLIFRLTWSADGFSTAVSIGLMSFVSKVGLSKLFYNIIVPIAAIYYWIFRKKILAKDVAILESKLNNTPAADSVAPTTTTTAPEPEVTA